MIGYGGHFIIFDKDNDFTTISDTIKLLDTMGNILTPEIEKISSLMCSI